MSLPFTYKQITQKAQAAFDLGRPKESIPLFLQALDCAGSSRERAYIMVWLAEAFHATDDGKNAILWIDRALATAPDYEWAYRVRASILERAGRNDEAIEAACTARQFSPETPQVYHILASLYLNKNDYEQASLNAERFRDLAPDDANVYYYLALIALNRAKKDKKQRKALLTEAEKHLHDGFALEPESPFLHRIMGKLRSKQNRNNEAIPHYLTVARQFPYSVHDQNNVKDSIGGLLFGQTPVDNQSLLLPLFVLCIVAQTTGGFVPWGAWAIFCVSLLLSTLLLLLVLRFPDYGLLCSKEFYKLTHDSKNHILRLAAQKRGALWNKWEMAIAAPFMSLVVTVPPFFCVVCGMRGFGRFMLGTIDTNSCFCRVKPWMGWQ